MPPSTSSTLYLCPETDSLNRLTHSWVLILASPDTSSCTFYPVHKRQIGVGTGYYASPVLVDVDLYSTPPISTGRATLHMICSDFDRSRHNEVVKLAERALTDSRSETQSWARTFLAMLVERGLIKKEDEEDYLRRCEPESGTGRDGKLEDLMGGMGIGGHEPDKMEVDG
ncbi:hypothetical protein BDV18DRAFT_161974 [Aspergillus unguis]